MTQRHLPFETHPINPLALDASETRRHCAVHEAGHAVIGLDCGLTLLDVRLGPKPLDDKSESLALGGTRFDAPDGDQNELARQKPDDVAVMAMAGLCAEEVVLGRHLRQGWLRDIEILRIGLGWLEGTDEPPARLFQYLADAHQATRTREPAIRDVAEALFEAGFLNGSEVTALAAPV